MQQDFILRLIERLGVFFAAIRKLIVGGGDPSEIEERLNHAAGQAGFDLDLLRRLDLPSLLAVVAPGGEVDVARAWSMAEILLLDGLRASAGGDPDEAVRHLTTSRALFDLFGTGFSVTRDFPEAGVRIAEIDEEIARLARTSAPG